MKIAALVSDLVFTSKVRELASQGGAEVMIGRSPDKLIEVLKSEPVNMVVLDLEKIGPGVGDVMRQIREVLPEVQVLGFYSHVNEDTANAAEEAGVNLVWPRSKFVKSFPEMLRP